MFNDTAVTTLLVELTLIARQWILTSDSRIDLDDFEQLEIICCHTFRAAALDLPHILQPALWVWKAANTTVSTIEMVAKAFVNPRIQSGNQGNPQVWVGG
jgi:hypothetical protein